MQQKTLSLPLKKHPNKQIIVNLLYTLFMFTSNPVKQNTFLPKSLKQCRVR